MSIKLPRNEFEILDKHSTEEVKADSKKYEINAKAYTEALNLAKEILKTYQKIKDVEIAKTEWRGKNDLEAKRIERALINLENVRKESENSAKKLEVQKDHWATIKYILHNEYEIIKQMPVSDERIKMVDQINTMLKNLNNYKPG